MSFVVGQLVRPSLAWLRRTGVLSCFQGKLPAQGRVTAIFGPSILLSSWTDWWDPNTSTPGTPAGASGTNYTVQIWNMETSAYEFVAYPEAELAAGTVNGVVVSALIADPTTDEAAANLVRSRT